MTLSNSDRQSIINAVAACSPTGGGSDMFTLQRKLRAEWDITEEDEVVGSLQQTAYSEVIEALHDGEDPVKEAVRLLDSIQDLPLNDAGERTIPAGFLDDARRFCTRHYE